MDFLRQQLATLNERLAGLTATQKLLTAALAVIVVMTLLYWGKSASNTEMIALLPGTVSGQELTNVTTALKAKGITYETGSNGQILVPASRQGEALMEVSSNGSLGAQTIDAFQSMIASTSPLDSEGKWNAQLNHYYETRFAQIISHGAGISSADVTITYPPRTGIARVPPAAHVYITTKPESGVSRRKMAEGAANVIATSIGIERARVGVTIDGSPYNINDPNNPGMGGGVDGVELVDQTRYWENHYAEKVRSQFADIPGLRVDVTVRIDNETAQTVKNDVDNTRKVSLPRESTSERSTSTELSRAQNEPGVMSNVPLSVNNGSNGGGGNQTSTERSTESNLVDYGRSQTTSYKPAGMGTALAAAIRVPRSYFTSLYQRQNGPNAAAQGTQFEQFIASELDRMRQVVKQQTQVESDSAVTATEYADATPATDDAIATGGPMLAAADTTGGGSLKVFAAGHAKDVGVGVLALASLFMVGRMVKKSTPPAPEPVLALDNDVTPLVARMAATSGAVAATVRAAGAKTLQGAEELAGDVIESGPVMMGQELDEAILETSQMVDQVGSFVKDNPEMAAQLISRWMSRE